MRYWYSKRYTEPPFDPRHPAATRQPAGAPRYRDWLGGRVRVEERAWWYWAIESKDGQILDQGTAPTSPEAWAAARRALYPHAWSELRAALDKWNARD